MPNDKNIFSFVDAWTTSTRKMMDGYARMFGPEQLSQPILPGWNFGNMYFVSEENSRDPGMERQILAENSYGRQLGRIMDALTVLVNQQSEAARAADGPLKEFLDLAEEIREIKERARTRRVDNLRSSLASLRQQCPQEFKQLMEEFRER